MTLWGPTEYGLVRLLLQCGLALIYLLAFLVAARQFRPLAGEDGLLPLSRYVEAAEFRERPSPFRFVPDGSAIGLAAWTGVALAALALVGLPGRVGWEAAMVVRALLWALYLSFVNAGQLFYGYGWETMLLEAGFLAVFLGGGGVAPPEIVVWLFRWLLLRNTFGAGLIKLRGDNCWTALTCLDYHYETHSAVAGTGYAADFYLPGADLWIEVDGYVEGDRPNEEEFERKLEHLDSNDMAYAVVEAGDELAAEMERRGMLPGG